MRPLILVVALPVALYAGICFLLYLFQKRMVFHPDRELVATPEDVGLRYEEVTFTTEDGVRLHGWWVPAPEPRGAVLFCHGNAGNVSHRLNSLKLFHDLGLTALAFDYRSYGRSDGTVSETGTYADVRAAWRFLVEGRGIRPERIVLFGRSLGAAVAVELATHVNPAALVAESAFTSAAELGKRYYPWLPVNLLLRIHYDSASRVSRIAAPKLFIHSVDDEIIPFDLGRRLFEAAAEPKRLLQIRGPHNGGWMASRERYVQGWIKFLDSIPLR